MVFLVNAVNVVFIAFMVFMGNTGNTVRIVHMVHMVNVAFVMFVMLMVIWSLSLSCSRTDEYRRLSRSRNQTSRNQTVSAPLPLLLPAHATDP